MFDSKNNPSLGLADRTGTLPEAGKILILGLGNILLSDEGIGVHAAQELQNNQLPSNVEVIDGGTSSLDILLSEQNIQKLIVIDALKAGNEPGTVYKANLRAGQFQLLEQFFNRNDKISLHQVSLFEALTAAKYVGNQPKEIVIIAVEPKEIGPGLTLSTEVEKVVPKLISKVLEEI